MPKRAGSGIFLFLFTAALQASVTATLDRSAAERGESVTLTLRVEGRSFRVPKIETLCGVGVEKAGHRSAVDTDEDGFRKSELYSYTFRPKSDCVIGPIRVEADGVESYTQPLKVEVLRPGQKEEKRITLELRSSKTAPYVGEPFTIEVVLRKSDGAKILSSLADPDMRHLWVKRALGTSSAIEDGSTVETKRYLVAAQRSGRLRVGPAEVKVATDYRREDAWGNPKEERVWESHYSNILELDVASLPEGVTLAGDFSLSLEIAERDTEAQRPITAEIVIRGSGNFEDIAAFKPAIGGVEVLAGEPRLERTEEGTEEVWRQQLTFVADNDFTIPSIGVAYFDTERERVKRVQTQPVAVHVAASEKAVAAPERKAVAEESGGEKPGWSLFLALLGAAAAALLFMLLRPKGLKAKLQKARPDGDRAALQILLGYREDADAEAMIERLEARLYEGRDVEIDRKALKCLLKRISRRGDSR